MQFRWFAILTFVSIALVVAANPSETATKDIKERQPPDLWADVLRGTGGVDFGPYLSNLLKVVHAEWYNRIPVEARRPLQKKGRVYIRILILPNGKVEYMQISNPSGEDAFDRAAWYAITKSSPFPPLPTEFSGPYLALRLRFYYNSKPGDYPHSQIDDLGMR